MQTFKTFFFMLLNLFILSSCLGKQSKNQALTEPNSRFQLRKMHQLSELQISFLSGSTPNTYRMLVKPILFASTPEDLSFKIIIKTGPRYQNQGPDEQVWTPDSSQEELEWLVSENLEFKSDQDRFYFPIEIYLIPISQESAYLSFKTQTATHLPKQSNTKKIIFETQNQKNKNLKIFY